MYNRAVAKHVVRVPDAAAADGDRRRVFTRAWCQDMAVYPLTLEIAQLAGRFEASKQRAESASRLQTF